MKNTPKIIGVVGGMHSGKGAVTDILLNQLDGYKNVRYADPIKDYLSSLTGIPKRKLDEFYIKQQFNPILDKTIREGLTTIGKLTTQLFGEDIFIKSLFHVNKDTNFIVSDVRFVNEAEAIVNNGGLIIKVIRHFGLRFPELKEYQHPHNEYNFDDRRLIKDYPEMYEMLTDRSEVEVDNIFANVTVENNFDLNELERQVNTLWI
jgi:hypothetical protein